MYYIGGIEMAKRRLGFGIIGCGMIAEYHVSALEDLHDKAKIIGVADPVRDSAERLAGRHGLKRSTSKLKGCRCRVYLHSERIPCRKYNCGVERGEECRCRKADGNNKRTA